MKHRAIALALAAACAGQAFAQTEPRRETAPLQSQGSPQVTNAPSAAAGGSATVPDIDEAAARELFRKLDRNGDGCLTHDELWSDLGRRGNWAAVDRDRNGCISLDEFTVVRSR
jgi:hypothetical protein